MDKPTQRQPRHVGNIVVAEVNAQCDHCGNLANVRFVPIADIADAVSHA